MRSKLIPILLFALLAGCTTVPTATPIVIPTFPPPPSATPTLAVTATPVPPTPLPATSAATRAPASPTVPPTAAPATSAPTAAVGPAGTPVPPDCKAIPGFPGCGQALPLSGKLALYNESTQLIQVLDFNTRLDLQVKPKAGNKGLEWQDSSSLSAVGADNQPGLAWVNPAISKLPTQPITGPQGQPAVRSAEGSAWLEQKDGRFLFHVRLAGSAQEQVFPAEAQPSDKIHDLIAWAPGTNLILAGYHFASNSMWITGDQLYTLDARSGAIKEMPASMRANTAFSWNPRQPGLLAFGDTSQAQLMGQSRLAVLDVNSAKVVYPILDAAVSSTDPAWLPDGSAILHASVKTGGTPPANDPFALPGIYRTQWPAGTTGLITNPPQGARDGWPQPEADGKNFLFARFRTETKQGEVRVTSLDGKLDAPVVSAVNLATAIQPLGIYWPQVLAYTP